MFGFLSALGALYTGKKLISEALDTPYEPGCRDNKKLYEQDRNKVRFGEMTQKQFERNLRAGVYRDNRALPDYDLWIRRLETHIKYWSCNHCLDPIRLDMLKQRKARGQQIDDLIDTYNAEWLDQLYEEEMRKNEENKKEE